MEHFTVKVTDPKHVDLRKVYDEAYENSFYYGRKLMSLEVWWNDVPGRGYQSMDCINMVLDEPIRDGLSVVNCLGLAFFPPLCPYPFPFHDVDNKHDS